MTKETTQVAAVLLAGLALAVAGCGNSGEDGLEQLIERETGEDVEIDLGGGGINVVTSDGSFTIDDEGNIEIVGPDGEVITGEIDPDDNSIDIQSADGDVSIQGDGDTGEFEITDEEGNVTFSSSQEIPDEWPADVPQPTGLAIITGSVIDDGTNLGITVIGTTSASPTDHLDSYRPMLESAGFTQTTFFESGDGVSAFFESPVWSVTYAGFADSGETTVTVGVTPVAG